MEKKSFIIRGRMLSPGKAKGEALIAATRISFWGGFSPKTGEILQSGSEFHGKSIKDKVVIFLSSKGSSGTSNCLNLAKRFHTAPAAFVNTDLDCLAVAGCQIHGIPMMTDLDQDPFAVIKNGDFIKIDATNGVMEVFPQEQAPR